VKRYAVDTNTLAESSDGAVVMVADLPVEALERAIEVMELYERTRANSWPKREEHKAKIHQLRDLLMAIRPEVKS